MQQFNNVAAIFVWISILSAIIVFIDLRDHKQSMRIMRSVWILTTLWSGVFGLWAYFAFGRAKRKQHNKPMKMMPKMKMDRQTMSGMNMDMQRPKWQSVVLSTLHCGAGCTLADIVGEWLIYLLPIAIGGSLLAGRWGVEFILALIIGIGFQLAAIRSMERISVDKALKRAVKADILSLTSWQAGMYGWMAIVIFVFHNGIIPSPTSYTFWFMMQIAMFCGFLVALPVNIILIRLGIKKGM